MYHDWHVEMSTASEFWRVRSPDSMQRGDPCWFVFTRSKLTYMMYIMILFNDWLVVSNMFYVP